MEPLKYGFSLPPPRHGGELRGVSSHITMPRTMLRVLVLHPNPLSRRYLRACLGEDVTVVAEASSSCDVLDKIAETRPDVVLADLLLSDETGFQLAARLRCEAPGTVTVLLTDAGRSALRYLDGVARANGAAGVLPYASLSGDALISLAGAAGLRSSWRAARLALAA